MSFLDFLFGRYNNVIHLKTAPGSPNPFVKRNIMKKPENGINLAEQLDKIRDIAERLATGQSQNEPLDGSLISSLIEEIHPRRQIILEEKK